MSPKQINLLRRVKEQILREPAQFVMGELFTRSEFGTRDLEREVPHCGTAACIGGWAIALSVGMTPSEAAEGQYRGWEEDAATDAWDRACEALGLELWTEGEETDRAHQLMSVWGWPRDLREAWEAEQTLEGRARIAAERIDRFIAEEEARGEEKQ